MKRQSLDAGALARDKPFGVLSHAVPGFVWVADGRGRIRHVSGRWSAFTGLSNARSMKWGWLDAVHPDDVERIKRLWTPQALRDKSALEVELRCRRHDGLYRWHLLRALPDSEGSDEWVACTIDIHDRVAAQLAQEGQVHVLEMIASGMALDDILCALCRLAEDMLPDTSASVVIIDEQAGRFDRCVAPSLPTTMTDCMRGAPYQAGAGSCGTAAAERRDVIVADIATDPLWAGARDKVLPYGLQASWSKPIISSSGVVLATFGFYFNTIRVPTPEEMARMDAIKHLATLALERHQREAALRESEEHYRHTVELNPQIPWVSDADGNIVSVSSRWKDATGLTPEESLGNKWTQAVHRDDKARVFAHWTDRLASGEPADVEYRIRLRDGRHRWVRSRGTPRRDEQGHILRWYGTLEDVHERRSAEEKLEQAAYQDELTRLPNRRHFEESLRRLLSSRHAQGGRVGLLVMDLDDFKQVNDRFGHAVGDSVIRLFGHHLNKSVRNGDRVARLGGDEFAVILTQVETEDEVRRQAHMLSVKLDRQLKRSARVRSCRVSIGAVMSRPGEGADELFRKADLALYACKADSRGGVRIFTPAIRKANVKKLDEIELARKALAADWIVPHYQPKVSLVDGTLAGFEALVRVAHPRDGVLPPSAIWAALDDPRTGGLIGDRMLGLVLTDIQKWTQAGLDCGHIALNLSTEAFHQPEYAERLLERMKKAAVPAHRLRLEVTERVLIDQMAETIRRSLSILRKEGAGVSLDDFGTGYASLSHLRNFPVDEIKVDRSFIDDLGVDSENAAIVRAMIALGRSLGLSVVAEGIETPEQAILLRSWGCTVAQGYHFDRPMAPDAVPAAIARYAVEGEHEPVRPLRQRRVS